MEILRTVLSVPGIRPNMLDKARTLPADALALDLEDSVPWPEKRKARELVAAAMPGFALLGQQVYVRINAFDTGLAEEELEAIVKEGLDGINLPKVDSPQDIRRLDDILTFLEKTRGLNPGRIKIIPWIESAQGVLCAHAIATASPRLVGLLFGAEDFTLDMGIEHTKEGTELFYARSAVAVAARAAGVLALDTPFTDLADDEGLVREARLARQLGYRGKFLIHPNQIEPVRRIFSPSPEEVVQARKVIEAYEAAAARGIGALSLEGQVIDTPVVARARHLLAWAEAVADREKGG